MPFVSVFRTFLRLAGAAMFASLLPAALAQTKLAADGYDPNINGNIFALVAQPDGKLLVAGNFDSIQPNGATSATVRARLARLNRDGTVDESFNPNVNGQIDTLALASDGSMVIGGKFTEVNGQSRRSVARLSANGTLDTAFDPNTGASLLPEVLAVAIQADGKILVGGAFTTVSPNGATTPITRNRLARFNADGSLDTAFNPSFNNVVRALALSADGSIVVGGGFTTVQGVGASAATNRNRVARLQPDGKLDTTFDPNVSNAVSAIAIQTNGKILIGGTFTTLTPNGATTATTQTSLARLNVDGTVDTTFAVAMSGNVQALLVQPDGRILMGGPIVCGAQLYAARLLPDGTLDSSFTPNPNFNVYAFALQPDGGVILGGAFTTLLGAGTNSTVRNHIARVTPTGIVDTDFRPDINGRLRNFAVQADGKVIISGTFTSVAGTTHVGIVRLKTDGSVDTSFTTSVNGTVAVIAPQADGAILLGGSFVQVNGVDRRYLARIKADGTLDTAFTAQTSGQVNAIVQQSDGKIIIGGAFTTVTPTGATDATAHYYLARLNADGTLDADYNPNCNGIVACAVLQSDGNLLVGGSFNTFQPGGTGTVYNRYSMARLKPDGKVDTVFDPNVNGSILGIAVQSDGKVIFAGSFKQLAPNGSPTIYNRFNLARVNADGSMDASYDPAPNSTVYSISLQPDGKLVLGGLFTSFAPNGGAGVGKSFLARLTTDGKVDTTFDTTVDNAAGNFVNAVKATSDNKVFVGGSFNNFKHGSEAPVARLRLARLNADGSVDAAFNSDFGSATGAVINAVTLQTNGLILTAGSFSGLNGTTGTNFAQFWPDGTPYLGVSPIVDGTVSALSQLITKGTAVLTPQPGFVWLQPNGSIRTFTFGSGFDVGELLHVLVQPDGKFLLCGDLAVNGVKAPVIRVNPDGTLDSSFTVLTGSGVSTMALQSDGKIIIGGTFSTLNSASVAHVARLNANGTVDSTFNQGTDNTVLSIVVQSDGKIIIAGLFNSITPNGTTSTTTRNYVARLNTDGSLDTGYNPNFNAAVEALHLLPSGKLMVGGQFTSLTPNGATAATTRQFLARLNTDGTPDTTDFKLDASVFHIAPYPGDKLIVTGAFSSILGTTRNYIARLNADDTVDSFNPNPNSTVSWVATQADGRIVIGGQFTALQPNSTSTVFDVTTATIRSFAARLNADGTVDPSFNPNFNAQVTRVYAYPNGIAGVPNNTLIALGSFTSIQPNGSILVGGTFNTVNGAPVKNLALFSSDGSVSATFLPNPNGNVNVILPLEDDRLVIAGSFTALWNGAGAVVGRNYIARIDNNDLLDATFDPNANAEVYSAGVLADGKLVVGGAFTRIGGGLRSYLARLQTNGSLDTSFAPTVTGTVRTLALQRDGRVLALVENPGGTNTLQRFNTDGSTDTSFAPVASSPGRINALMVQADGRIVIGGSFTTVGGTSHPYLARLFANGALDPSLTAAPNGPVQTLNIGGDGKILIGGAFNAVDGLPRFGIARLASASTAPAQSFALGADGTSVTWRRSGGVPEVYAVIFETSTDWITWTFLGYGTRVPGTGDWRVSGVTLPTSTTGVVYVRTRGGVVVPPNGSTGHVADFGALIAGLPVISSATAVTATAGSSFAYSIVASGSGVAYSASGLPPGLSLDTTTGRITGTPTKAGAYNVVLSATSAAGTTRTALYLVVSPQAVRHLVNLSVNATASAANPVIAGFGLLGLGSQNILTRAIGPGLAPFGVTDTLPQPHLRLVRIDAGNAVVAEGDNWGGGSDLIATFNRVGAFPLAQNSTDAALQRQLGSGLYSVLASDRGSGSGTALVEIYDAAPVDSPATAPRLINLSARGTVAGGHLVTGGFVIGGASATRILLRAVGPSLSGVSGRLADPAITLYRHVSTTDPAVIAYNDNWDQPVVANDTYGAASATDITTAGNTYSAAPFAAGSKDAAVLVTLPPGVYSAQVSGVNGATGEVLVELFDLP